VPEGKVIEHSAPPSVRIPGGWAIHELSLGSRDLALWIPADPDAFLEDEESVAAHGPLPEKPDRSDIPFWQYLWPAAESMARLVHAHDWPSSGPMLELGAGLGLVGLAGLAAGHSVTFSDYQEPALQVADCNARLNGFADFDTLLLDWNCPGAMHYPVILGCEVIYERAIHRPILNVLDHMLTNGGQAWLGDPGRSNLPYFIDEAERRGYSVEIQNANGKLIPNPTFGEFQLLILRIENCGSSRMPRGSVSG
jgi:predicted nicotinamide N-methyase